ncbi:hypothetical protein V8E51_002701 [Hyaloscypha variabilis]
MPHDVVPLEQAGPAVFNSKVSSLFLPPPIFFATNTEGSTCSHLSKHTMENLLQSTEDENRKGAVILNTDVWFLVLEEHSEILREEEEDKGWTEEGWEAKLAQLRSLRLVSQDFYRIMTPIFYKYLDFSKHSLVAKLTQVNSYPCDSIKRNIIAHTKFLEMTTENNDQVLSAACDLISKSQRLESMTWEKDTVHNAQYFATVLLDAFLWNSQSCFFGTYEQLGQISQMGHNYETPDAPKTINARFPTLQTSSSNMSDDVPSRPQLRHLMIDFCWGIDYLAPIGERLPLMKKLTLTSYEWVHTREEYVKKWDFSKLLSLNLDDKFHKFIGEAAGVPPDDLAKLESFKISGNCYSQERPPMHVIKRSLGNFISKLKSLKKFNSNTTNGMSSFQLSFLHHLLETLFKRSGCEIVIDLAMSMVLTDQSRFSI